MAGAEFAYSGEHSGIDSCGVEKEGTDNILYPRLVALGSKGVLSTMLCWFRSVYVGDTYTAGEFVLALFMTILKRANALCT